MGILLKPEEFAPSWMVVWCVQRDGSYLQGMGVNNALKRQMKELGLTQEELARRLNSALEEITGKEGSMTDRSVRNLVNGVTRRPIGRTCVALEWVFGCRVEDLGFTPTRITAPPPRRQEVTVRRRVFIAAATGTAVAVAAPAVGASAGAPRRVGFSDVERLRERLLGLTSVDQKRGGHNALEEAALSGAKEALTLQEGNAGDAVKRRLLGLAADFTTFAGWSCTDSSELDRAQVHLDRAMTLAGMARDSTAQFRVWNNVAMVANQRKRFADAVMAGQAAQALHISRQDPMFASLAFARTAIGQAKRGDRQAALRSLGHAGENLGRAVEVPRPAWMDFYCPGELLGLTATAQLHLGDAEESERAAHQALTGIPEHFIRNRSMVSVRLAHAQLRQGELEQSHATATRVLDTLGQAARKGRMRLLLDDYRRDLLELFPGTAQAHDWTEQVRMKWS